VISRAARQLGGQLHLEPEHVLDVEAGQRADHEAAAGFQFDHVLAAQREQRLAYRCDTDAELGGDRVEPDELTWAQLTGDDRLAQVRGDLVGQLRSGAQWPDHGHRIYYIRSLDVEVRTCG
jgi:hypothetical protein